MNLVKVAGMVFYVIINFISPVNPKPISQIRGYYQKEGAIIKIQSSDYYGDLSSEQNKETGERWEEIQHMHNILVLGGWKNIEYTEFQSKFPILVSIVLNQTEVLYGKKYYGIYFSQKNGEKSFLEYKGEQFKEDVFLRIERICRN